MKRASIFSSAFTEVLSFQDETFTNFSLGTLSRFTLTPVSGESLQLPKDRPWMQHQ